MLFDLEFKKLTIELNESKDRILLWNQISKKLELIEDVVICMNQFTPVFASWPQNISITNSVWFTLEQLLACTCTRITLDWSHFKNKDLEVILKNWKAGGLPNLEYLYIGGQNITNNGELIMGINWRELDGMVFQTDDGLKMATIKTNVRSIEMSVTRFE